MTHTAVTHSVGHLFVSVIASLVVMSGQIIIKILKYPTRTGVDIKHINKCSFDRVN